MAAELTVVANTADDVEVYGVHVSPDPDLVTYWLADAIDERGWGLRDDTWKVMDALEAAGAPHWFRLGDRDLAICLMRTERLRAGASLTRGAGRRDGGAGRRGARAADVGRAGHDLGRRTRPDAAVPGVHDRRARRGPRRVGRAARPRAARPSAAVLDAIAEADAIVIGPSNPVISIGPILALPGHVGGAAGRAPRRWSR